LALLLLVILFAGCRQQKQSVLERIWQQNRITVITDNNAHCFYNYRDEAMGFEYDLARAFADYLVVDLKVITPGWDTMVDALYNDWGDFIAASLTRTPQRAKRIQFSRAYLTVQQQIIVHKANRDINSIADLSGRAIHVRRGTSYQEQIEALQEDGLDINLVLHDNVPTEELIRQVAEREITVTVADTNVAHLNRRYFPNIRIAFPISPEQSIAWAVRKQDRQLLREMNKFFGRIIENGTFGRIYDKYYGTVEIFDYVDLKVFQRRLESRLPRYEYMVRREAARYGFDWRLIVALMYQESHFDPKAKSHTGVRGLMQLTRHTAEEMNVSNRLDPEQSIRGGVQYLNKLYDRFDDIPERNRMWFTLAAYNVGYGHVRDAQMIASSKGLDPLKWASLKKTLPLLRFPRYYQNTRFGYARGTEPVRYVERIRTYYDILRWQSLRDPAEAWF
jgi:membrane-bound lytic murein transglycosylase F